MKVYAIRHVDSKAFFVGGLPFDTVYGTHSVLFRNYSGTFFLSRRDAEADLIGCSHSLFKFDMGPTETYFSEHRELEIVELNVS